MSELVSRHGINDRVLVIRGQRVMLDADLAELYGVTTKRFNEQVKRNLARFPLEFMFQLTAVEKKEVVANCDHLDKLKFSPHLPYAFTEHGAIMAATILNSPKAVEMSRVGWVERSETHRTDAAAMMGFAIAQPILPTNAAAVGWISEAHPPMAAVMVDARSFPPYDLAGETPALLPWPNNHA